MAYATWSVVFGEQPSASKWNILGTNDAFFYTYTGEGTNAIQQMVYNVDGAVATGTTILPYDDTIPQSGEGNQFMTQAITPKSATNILVIEATLFVAFSASTADINAALFQDSTANAIAAVGGFYQETPNHSNGIKVKHVMVAGTTSATTFKIRVGSSQTGTVTFNGSGAARKFGAIAKSTMTITEYKV